MKKFSVLLLCLSLILSSFSFVTAINFSDVPEDAYYAEPVYNLAWFGILGGYPDSTFRPTKTITRAEMAVHLVNMAKLSPYTAARPKFPDVEKTHWAYKYVEAAADAGYINGYPDGTFRPDKNVSYDEAITMIVAMMGYTLKDLEGTYPTAFTNKARDLGILNTCAILGGGAATRANVACFIRDSLLASTGNADAFRFKGDTYAISIGADHSYYVENGTNRYDGYQIRLYVTNTSSSPISYTPASFPATIGDKRYDPDTDAYPLFDEFDLPSGTIPAGQTVTIDLLYPCGIEMSSVKIQPDLCSGTETEIELLF